MEEKKKISVEELKRQLIEAQQMNTKLYQEAQREINRISYENAFIQQNFMMDIVKNSETFKAVGKEELVAKAIDSIEKFWFKVVAEEQSQPQSEEVSAAEVNEIE